MNHELVTVLWMWLTPAIVFCITLYTLSRSGYLVSNVESLSHRWWLPNIILILTIFLCIAYQAEVNKVGWVGEWFLYLIFEYAGSWIVGGTVLCISVKIFDAKQRYLNQKFSFNLDPMELGADKYVVKIELNNYHRDNPHQLVLYRTVREKDMTGEYVIFRHEHTFPHEERHFYTKEKVTEILKDYFDAKRVFQVEGTTGKEVIVEVKPKQAEVIIIPQGD